MRTPALSIDWPDRSRLVEPRRSSEPRTPTRTSCSRKVPTVSLHDVGVDLGTGSRRHGPPGGSRPGSGVLTGGARFRPSGVA